MLSLKSCARHTRIKEVGALGVTLFLIWCRVQPRLQLTHQRNLPWQFTRQRRLPLQNLLPRPPLVNNSINSPLALEKEEKKKDQVNKKFMFLNLFISIFMRCKDLCSWIYGGSSPQRKITVFTSSAAMMPQICSWNGNHYLFPRSQFICFLIPGSVITFCLISQKTQDARHRVRSGARSTGERGRAWSCAWHAVGSAMAACLQGLLGTRRCALAGSMFSSIQTLMFALKIWKKRWSAFASCCLHVVGLLLTLCRSGALSCFGHVIRSIWDDEQQ